MTTKICRICKEIKPVELFYKDRASKTGFRSKCKECDDAYHRSNWHLYKDNAAKRAQKRRENPVEKQRLMEVSKMFWTAPYGRAYRLFNGALKSATTKKYGSTLTFNHVLEGVERGTCAVTGIKFDLQSSKITRNNPYAPSLDRINPKLPYTDENVRVVIWQFNIMKGEISDAEMYLIAHSIITGLEKQWR